jgi:ribonuclease HI
MLIEIFCDGSSDGKSGGMAGWAYVICVDGVKVAEGAGQVSNASNNVAEVVGAIRGLDHVATTDITGCTLHGDTEADGRVAGTDSEPKVVLISDSQLTLRWATGEYRCKKWHLIPYVIELRKALERLKATTRWVRGHSGNEHNERCDVLAKAAREGANGN